jgi:hypothetical protein
VQPGARRDIFARGIFELKAPGMGAIGIAHTDATSTDTVGPTSEKEASMRLGRFIAGAVGLTVGVMVVREAMARARRAPPRAPGGPKTQTKQTIEFVARILQSRGPLREFNLHLVGFRPLRDDPQVQTEVHLYCRLINDDFAQCVAFDGDGPDARLTGVEYLISERLYDRLRPEEQAYWHPSNYELLSGQMVAPGLPSAIERELVRLMLNGYGKGWQFWPNAGPDRPGRSLPFGDALLTWSFNRDGEIDPRLVAERDERLGTRSDRRRQQRECLRWLAAPQGGEDLLRDQFPATQAVDPSDRDD